MSSSTSANCKYYDEWAYVLAKLTTSTTTTPLKRGDRVRIREGYDGAGDVGFYDSKSSEAADMVEVRFQGIPMTKLAAAIEPYPYSREERIERAIEDYESTFDHIFGEGDPLHVDDRALLFAILDAGI